MLSRNVLILLAQKDARSLRKHLSEYDEQDKDEVDIKISDHDIQRTGKEKILLQEI